MLGVVEPVSVSICVLPNDLVASSGSIAATAAEEGDLMYMQVRFDQWEHKLIVALEYGKPKLELKQRRRSASRHQCLLEI